MILALFQQRLGPLFQSGTMLNVVKLLPSYWLVQASRVAVGGEGWSGEAWAVTAAWTCGMVVADMLTYRVTRRESELGLHPRASVVSMHEAGKEPAGAGFSGGPRRWVEERPPGFCSPGLFGYVGATAAGVAQYSSGAKAVAGYTILAAFCCCFLVMSVWVGRLYWLGGSGRCSARWSCSL